MKPNSYWTIILFKKTFSLLELSKWQPHLFHPIYASPISTLINITSIFKQKLTTTFVLLIYWFFWFSLSWYFLRCYSKISYGLHRFTSTNNSFAWTPLSYHLVHHYHYNCENYNLNDMFLTLKHYFQTNVERCGSNNTHENSVQHVEYETFFETCKLPSKTN